MLSAGDTKLCTRTWRMRAMNQGAMKQKEAVEFLVKLAGLGDPANWRQGDLMNIIEDLRRSVEPPAGGKADKEIKRVFRQPMLLRPIIEELRDLVEAAVDGKQLKLRV